MIVKMEIAITIILGLGSLLILLGAIGLNRFPDIYMRMHAATKAPSLGISLMLIAFILYFGTYAIALKAGKSLSLTMPRIILSPQRVTGSILILLG